MTLGQEYTYAITVTGNVNPVIRVYRNSVEIGSYTDTNVAKLTSGRENGFWLRSYSGTYSTIDNFQIEAQLPDLITDSTVNANSLTAENSPVSATGQIDGARDFESSSSQYGEISDSVQTGLALSNDFTLSAWVSLETLPSVAGNNFGIVTKDLVTSGTRSYSLMMVSTDKLYVVFWDGSTNASAFVADVETITSGELGSKMMLTASVDISVPSATLYKNGVAIASSSIVTLATTINDSTTAFRMGARGDNNLFFYGIIDETRVSNTIRSGDWILTRYNNESDPSTFFSLDDPNYIPPSTVQWRIFGDEGLVA